MKTEVELTEQEKWVLLNKGLLVAIPKNKEDRNLFSYYNENIERVVITQYVPYIYLRDGDKWYIVTKDELPKKIRDDFNYL